MFTAKVIHIEKHNSNRPTKLINVLKINLNIDNYTTKTYFLYICVNVSQFYIDTDKGNENNDFELSHNASLVLK